LIGVARLDGNDTGAVQEAARRIAAGDLVAFPTETVYGLGARADDDAAVARIYATKGRPADHPLIVHVADVEAARRFARVFSPLAERLAAAFWPGPLTLIVPRADGVAAAAAGGHATLGLRVPAHPLAQQLLAEAAKLGVAGIAGPSANRFGKLSPTQAAHVLAEFGDALTVLDGGNCKVGIESTIVDVSRGRPVLLRPGLLGRERIEAAARMPLEQADLSAPAAAGTLAAHYAPRAKLRLMSAGDIKTALGVLGNAGGSKLKLAVYSRTVRPGIRASSSNLRMRPMPSDASAAAHELYAVLREFDDEGITLIWVEEPPADAAWDGVRDRLLRAAAAAN
jgi:L-threonylcarbamoyladenylate synthase